MDAKLPNKMPKEFWDWFDRRRRNLDLSDRGVAALAGIAHSVISKARNEERRIGYKALTKIAKAFEEDPSYVLGIAGWMLQKNYPNALPANDGEIVEFLHLLRQLSATDKKEILGLMRIKVEPSIESRGAERGKSGAKQSR